MQLSGRTFGKKYFLAKTAKIWDNMCAGENLTCHFTDI